MVYQNNFIPYMSSIDSNSYFLIKNNLHFPLFLDLPIFVKNL